MPSIVSIGDLLAVEPFGPICADTLARYWKARYGTEYRVLWFDHDPGPEYFQRRSLQCWRASTMGGEWLVRDAWEGKQGRSRPSDTDRALGIWPGVPASRESTIACGRRWLRLENQAERVRVWILKSGARWSAGAEGIAIRSAAGARLLCAPNLRASSISDGWFEEEIAGSPVAQPAGPSFEPESSKMLEVFAEIASTSHFMAARGVWLEHLMNRVGNELARCDLRDCLWRPRLEATVTTLRDHLARVPGPTEFPVRASCGDVAHAVCGRGGERVVIGDWTALRHRIEGFDRLIASIDFRNPQSWLALLAMPSAARGLAGVNSGSGSDTLHRGMLLFEMLAEYVEKEAEPWKYEPGAAISANLVTIEEAVRVVVHA